MSFRIAVIAPIDAQMLDIFGPLDVFKEANRVATGSFRFDTQLVAVDDSGVIYDCGYMLRTDLTVKSTRANFDLTLIVGASDQALRAESEPLSRWLQEADQKKRLIGSVCTGAFTLGAAGLLDGREVTTHWADASELARRFPAALVSPDRIFCRDERIYSSAGVTAGIDLALAIVEQIIDRRTALLVAKQLVVFLKRPGGQSQFSSHLAAQISSVPRIRKIQETILSDLAADHSHAKLASRAYMSTRSLIREFRAATGTTPRRFVERARFDEARRLIEEEESSLDSIAYRCGLGSREKMRRIFLRIIGINPSEYRDRFL